MRRPGRARADRSHAGPRRIPSRATNGNPRRAGQRGGRSGSPRTASSTASKKDRSSDERLDRRGGNTNQAQHAGRQRNGVTRREGRDRPQESTAYAHQQGQSHDEGEMIPSHEDVLQIPSAGTPGPPAQDPGGPTIALRWIEIQARSAKHRGSTSGGSHRGGGSARRHPFRWPPPPRPSDPQRAHARRNRDARPPADSAPETPGSKRGVPRTMRTDVCSGSGCQATRYWPDATSEMRSTLHGRKSRAFAAVPSSHAWLL